MSGREIEHSKYQAHYHFDESILPQSKLSPDESHLGSDPLVSPASSDTFYDLFPYPVSKRPSDSSQYTNDCHKEVISSTFPITSKEIFAFSTLPIALTKIVSSIEEGPPLPIKQKKRNSLFESLLPARKNHHNDNQFERYDSPLPSCPTSNAIDCPTYDPEFEYIKKMETRLIDLYQTVENQKLEIDKKDKKIQQLQHQLALENSRTDNLLQTIKDHVLHNESLQLKVDYAVNDEKQRSTVEIIELQERVDAMMTINKELNSRNLSLSQQLHYMANKDDIDMNMCCICLSYKSCVVLFPCKHTVLCDKCCNKIVHCPVCRERVKETHQIYLS